MILYEDAALVVLDKPAGLSSEEGVPAALRAHWNAPDAFVGVVHRLDTGVSGLMVYARTPAAAAALPAHHKNGLLEKKAILPAIFAGLAAAGLAAWISTGLDTRLLRKLFGLFLLYVGITQLVQRDDR